MKKEKERETKKQLNLNTVEKRSQSIYHLHNTNKKKV